MISKREDKIILASTKYCKTGNGNRSREILIISKISASHRALIVDDVQGGRFTILDNSSKFISSKCSESGFAKV